MATVKGWQDADTSEQILSDVDMAATGALRRAAELVAALEAGALSRDDCACHDGGRPNGSEAHCADCSGYRSVASVRAEWEATARRLGWQSRAATVRASVDADGVVTVTRSWEGLRRLSASAPRVFEIRERMRSQDSRADVHVAGKGAAFTTRERGRVIHSVTADGEVDVEAVTEVDRLTDKQTESAGSFSVRVKRSSEALLMSVAIAHPERHEWLGAFATIGDHEHPLGDVCERYVARPWSVELVRPLVGCVLTLSWREVSP